MPPAAASSATETAQQPVEVVFTWGNYGKRWGRRTTSVRCNDRDHARNVAQSQIRKRGQYDLVKVTVWLDDNHCAVWTQRPTPDRVHGGFYAGWHPVREQRK